MTEPNYTYVKGKGWIVQNLETLDFTDFCGKKWTLVARKPEIGEFGTYSNITNEFYVRGCKPHLLGWANYFKDGVRTSLVNEQTYKNAEYAETERGWTCVWVTVIPA